MFYLVLAISNREVTLTTIPEKYNKEQCETISKFWKENTNGNSRMAWCIPAPKLVASSNTLIIPTYPGYYCGLNDCSLKEK